MKLSIRHFAFVAAALFIPALACAQETGSAGIKVESFEPEKPKPVYAAGTGWVSGTVSGDNIKSMKAIKVTLKPVVKKPEKKTDGAAAGGGASNGATGKSTGPAAASGDEKKPPATGSDLPGNATQMPPPDAGTAAPKPADPPATAGTMPKGPRPPGKPLTTNCDEKGVYTFKDVPEGEYEVVAFLVGVGTGRMNVTVVAGETKTIDLQVKPAEKKQPTAPNGRVHPGRTGGSGG